MAYASPTDLIDRYDARRIGDFCSDDGDAVAESDLATDDKVLAALQTASGEVDAALQQGKRYTPAQLTGLTGNSLAYLKQLVCDLAFCRLYERRGWSEEGESPELTFKRNQEALKRLRIGENVFNIDDQIQAGLPSLSTPSRVQIQRMNLMRDRLAGKYYPARVLPGEP